MDYTIENEIIKVTVSSTGAEIQSIVGKHIGNEYIWQADPEIWGRHAPVLFPIVGKLKNDEYSYQARPTTWANTALPEIWNLSWRNKPRKS